MEIIYDKMQNENCVDETNFLPVLESLQNKQIIDKDVIAYIVAAITEFAHKHHISVREANNYLIRFKGIDFLTEHYDAEYLLSFDDCVEDLTLVCQNNGGEAFNEDIGYEILKEEMKYGNICIRSN